MVETFEKFNCELSIENVSPSNLLGKLPDSVSPRYIKLSQSFVSALLQTDNQQAAQSLSRLLASDARVVAAAIEDSLTFARLWELGVRVFQGYFVQQPEFGFTYDFK